MAEWRFDPGQAKQELRDSLNSIPTTPDGYPKVEETTSTFHGLDSNQRVDMNRETIAKRPTTDTYGVRTVEPINVGGGVQTFADNFPTNMNYLEDSREARNRRLEEKAMNKGLARIIKFLDTKEKVVVAGCLVGAVILVGGIIPDLIPKDHTVDPTAITYNIDGQEMTYDEMEQHKEDVAQANTESMAEENVFAEQVQQSDIATQQANEALNESIDNRFPDATPMTENTNGRSI